MRQEVFKQKMESILSDNLHDRVVESQKHGKLSTRRIWKARTNQRVFSKKLVSKNKEYYFTFYLDISGSMTDSSEVDGKQTRRWEAMYLAVSKILESIKDIEGIHVRIIFFQSHPILIKDYHDKYSSKQLAIDLASCFSSNLRYQRRQNYTLDALGWTLEEIDGHIKGSKSKLPKPKTFYRYIEKEKGSYSYRNKYKTFIDVFKRTKKLDTILTDEYQNKNDSDSFCHEEEMYLEDGGTILKSALMLYPPNPEDKVFVFTDGDVVFTEEVKDMLDRLPNDIVGIGMQSTDIYKIIPFRNCIIVYEMADLFKQLSTKMAQIIKRG